MPSNVNLIDPLSVNINTNIVNGIPQYQDMFIYAELYAARKGRTVLVKTEGISDYKIEPTGLENDVRVNFIGVNQNQEGNDPNYLNFTTNYYDGSTGENVHYEGFGMSSIKITVNSSFVPQVNIVFTDTRGLAFFNRANSPYRILFDFPPPIFMLTVKGYYGRALSYQLHLVKYTSEFKAENGNFVIDAQFVATTFAPLTDVLLRYVINFPLIDNKESSSPDGGTRPANTNELILKLKDLYTSIDKDVKSSSETKEYDSIINRETANTDAINGLAGFRSKLPTSTTPYLITLDTSPNQSNFVLKNKEKSVMNPKLLYGNQTPTNEYSKSIITQLNSLLGYDQNVITPENTNGMPSNINKRLYIVYYIGQDITGLTKSNNSVVNDLRAILTNYRAQLIETAKAVGIDTNGIISDPQIFFNKYNITNDRTGSVMSKYIGIDVTDFYTKLNKNRTDLKEQKTQISKKINSIINQKLMENLGMKPTIYNIFKIILDDVDTFFEKIRQTSKDAEKHHNIPDYKQLILNNDNYKDTGNGLKGNQSSDKIFAFPLVIKRAQVYGGQRDERTAPIEISKKLPQEFPEIKLVNDFIDSFSSQKRYEQDATARNQLDENGNTKWIPVSPIDSILGTNDMKSPYTGVDNITGGGNGQPINLSSDNKIDQVLKIMLDRYYVLTQSAYPQSFYADKKQVNLYSNLFSQSEAANLGASIYSSDFAENVRSNVKKWISDAGEFYKYLENNPALKEYYDFPQINPQTHLPTKEYVEITNGSEGKIYVNKNFYGYRGLALADNDEIIMRTSEGSSDNPVDAFQDESGKGIMRKIFPIPEMKFEFTKENVIYLPDDLTSGNDATDHSNKIFEGQKLLTRFVDSTQEFTFQRPNNQAFADSIDYTNMNVKVLTGKPINHIEAINGVIANGNSFFVNKNGFNASSSQDSGNLKKMNFNSIIDVWVDILANHDTKIKADIFGSNNNLSAIMLLSNFGYTLSPFNLYPKNLNKNIFGVPAAVEVPAFLPAYLGACIEAKENGWDSQIKSFFETGAGKEIASSGLFILADITDANSILSKNDKELLKSAFRIFQDEYIGIREYGLKLIDQVNQTMAAKNIDNEFIYRDTKKAEYKKLLNPDKDEKDNSSTEYYYDVILPLMKSSNILTFSDITFRKETTPELGYKSIKQINDESKSNKTANDSYFTQFFSKLDQILGTKKKDLIEEEKEANKRKADEDLVTQTYYSFKNINDKWISSPIVSNAWGYPFNKNGKRLIDSFAFVDRAMNPIGDTVINAEMLIQMYDDPNITVYSALSQLLSLNGFEFFPLQNLMAYNDESPWEDSFKIDVSGLVKSSPAFVCMFIGGSSSYPSNMDNDFVEDGITDLSKTNAPDFQTTEPEMGTTSSEDNSQVANNTNFPWRKVRAFRVRFGEQNQSMFTDIKIDSKEYPETNESIQILARLAGDNKGTTPVPKGQNLYNLYENRAYRATITSMGNVMIQPTQYFQLENVPIFNGAYLILSVEHTIEPNKMMTSFSGTKILQYPVPRVVNPAALLGFDGGDADNTNLSDMSAGQISLGVGSENAPDMARYNSMYSNIVKENGKEVDKSFYIQ